MAKFCGDFIGCINNLHCKFVPPERMESGDTLTEGPLKCYETFPDLTEQLRKAYPGFESLLEKRDKEWTPI